MTRLLCLLALALLLAGCGVDCECTATGFAVQGTCANASATERCADFCRGKGR